MRYPRPYVRNAPPYKTVDNDAASGLSAAGQKEHDMPTIVRDGTTLAYEERGTGEPALVFVHGWTCDRSFFAPQAEHFARRHRVVSVDLRGHGESDKPEGPYSIATFADDIAYLMERLGLGRAVVVGHSMGGITVLQLAAAHPDRVAAIVMVDPAPFSIPPEVRPDVEALIAAIAAGHEEPRARRTRRRRAARLPRRAGVRPSSRRAPGPRGPGRIPAGRICPR